MVTLSNVTSHLYTGSSTLNGSKSFNSGNSQIDKFARKNLKLHAKAPGSGVTVLVDNNDGKKLVGYVTLIAHTLFRSTFDSYEKEVGKTPSIPVVKLNMLGVSLDYQKQGFGEQLIRIALDNTKVVSSTIGCAGLYLDAAPEAVEFYSKLGFEALSEPNSDTGIVPMFYHVDLIP